MYYNAISEIVPFFCFKVINMPSKSSPFDAHDFIDKYIFQRLSVLETARQLNVGRKLLNNWMKRNGFVPRNDKTLTIPNYMHASIVDIYQSGVGVGGIAKFFGYSEPQVRKLLSGAGIPLRGRSEQQRARTRASTPEAIAKSVQKAHAARRGQADPLEAKIKRAKHWQSVGKNRASKYELLLADALIKNGHRITYQLAVGPYNCDLATPSVAVEVFGGNWHWTGRHLARTEERFRYIMNRGYSIIAINIGRRFPFSSAVADYVSDLINELSSDPSRTRKYRVVWGAGEFSTGGCADDEHFSIEPPFTSVRDPASGRYITVPK